MRYQYCWLLVSLPPFSTSYSYSGPEKSNQEAHKTGRDWVITVHVGLLSTRSSEFLEMAAFSSPVPLCLTEASPGSFTPQAPCGPCRWLSRACPPPWRGNRMSTSPAVASSLSAGAALSSQAFHCPARKARPSACSHSPAPHDSLGSPSSHDPILIPSAVPVHWSLLSPVLKRLYSYPPATSKRQTHFASVSHTHFSQKNHMHLPVCIYFLYMPSP